MAIHLPPFYLNADLFLSTSSRLVYTYNSNTAHVTINMNQPIKRSFKMKKKRSLKIPQGIIRSHKSMEDRQYNCQKRKDKRTTFFLTSGCRSCYSCYEFGDKSWKRKEEPESVYNKWNISVVICDTDIRNGQSSHNGDRKSFEVMKLNFTNRKPGFSSFLDCINLISRKF